MVPKVGLCPRFPIVYHAQVPDDGDGEPACLPRKRVKSPRWPRCFSAGAAEPGLAHCWPPSTGEPPEAVQRSQGAGQPCRGRILRQ